LGPDESPAFQFLRIQPKAVVMLRIGRPTRKSLWLAIVATIALAVALPLPSSPFVSDAQAQEVRQRRSIIDFIFGNKRKKRVVTTPQYREPSVTTIPTKKKRKSSTAVARDSGEKETPKAVAKLPDAKKVLVIGDFMGAALADGLIMAMETEPGIVIEKETDGSSGLVRTDHLHWPDKLRRKIEEIKPSLVVVMLGSNDRQQMTIGGEKEKFRSDAWNAEYEKRVSELIKVAADARVPLIWTGLPSFQSPSLSADAATFNSMYRAKVEAAGGTFIDIWDGFADENGKFIASGSDINGQPVRLRGSDGLSLTKAGKRKMAFFLEKDLKRLIGAVSPELGVARLDSANQPVSAGSTPDFADIVDVAPVSLADPELDGTATLLDTSLLPKTSGKSPRDRLIEKGETVEAPAGRIDDYSWKEKAKPAEKPAG
jgi:hypothetical protein